MGTPSSVTLSGETSTVISVSSERIVPVTSCVPDSVPVVTPVIAIAAETAPAGDAESKLKILLAVLSPKMVSAWETEETAAMQPAKITVESFMELWY